MKYLNILILIFFTTKMFAGNEVGNGAAAIKCKDKTESLDSYEAKLLKRFEINKQAATDPFKMAQEIIEKNKSLDPKLFLIWENIAKSIQSRTKFLKNSELKRIDDSFEVAIPKDCQIFQIAVQKIDINSPQTSIYIDEDEWKKMSIDEQSIIILHEIIYEHLKQLGETNSTKVRYLTSLLFSKELKSETNTTFREKLIKIKLPTY